LIERMDQANNRVGFKGGFSDIRNTNNEVVR